MAGHRVAHATLTGPSVVKEIILGIAFGCIAGGIWKMNHWNQQARTKLFYDFVNKGEIILAAEE